MVAPGVVVPIATGCVYAPGAGLKVGVATVPLLTVYVPDATPLSVMPAAYAMAFKVVVAVNVTGPL
jgi:hypothetical protein